MQRKSLLIIGAVWVEPNSSAAGKRMLQLIEAFLERGYAVVFSSPSLKSEKAVDLISLGVDEVSIELNSISFDLFIKALQPEIVLFDRFMMEEQFGWRVVENVPKALRILDTEDLHCLRKTRELCLKKNINFSIDELLKQDITKREIAAILRCDLSLIISTFEMELLKNTFKIGENILMYLPFLLEQIETLQKEAWKVHEQREHFIFIGNFFHKPNIDAVLTLKNKIWGPLKKLLPKSEIHIYGAYLNQQVQELHHKKEGFIVKGFAANATEVIGNARVVLAPLNFGAGIKGKLTESMLCGTPSVTTSIGAEGMAGDFPWNGFITDDCADFIRKASELYCNAEAWNQAQLNGIAIINSFYCKEKNTALFFKKIEDIQQDMQAHRTGNFFGSLLQHQSLQATKYMSKWIEEKNKL
ncbi:putative glycosyltransferase [Polaribacter irgensii 23-P]|uniref:Putative glycosyltransferase n=1 Tax=Polaribacter irgensii 23-P TaxID=313594 RepID=A4BW63_9FLAO|nr:glycosyltransferase [Polaribacter irgensii]EAR13204.1 putative glycosyltransferase [Polaribacter irgensii 23-P]